MSAIRWHCYELRNEFPEYEAQTGLQDYFVCEQPPPFLPGEQGWGAWPRGVAEGAAEGAAAQGTAEHVRAPPGLMHVQ